MATRTLKTLLTSSFLLGCFVIGASSPMRAESFTAAKIRQFLSQYDKNLDLVARGYDQILNQQLRLRGPQGKIVGQLALERRRSRLGELHKTIHKLEMHPDNLVLSLTLQDQTEALLNDVEDASQIAFDNDYEEAGLQLLHLQNPLGHDQQIIEEYTFQLARAAQANLRKLRSDLYKSGRLSNKIHLEN